MCESANCAVKTEESEMTTKTELDLTLAVATARAFVIAEDGFEKAMMALERAIEPLSDDEFWPMVDAFRAEILGGFCSDRTTEQNAHNLHCHMAERGEAKALKYMRFAKAWEAKKSVAYSPLFDTIKDRGDDGYGDFLDSFPLVGREVFEKALTGYFGNEDAMKDAAREALRGAVTAKATSEYRTDEENAANVVKVGEELVSHIFHGENYNGMTLQEKGREVFRWNLSSFPCHGCDRDVSPTVGVDPQGLCDYCSTDDDFIARCKKIRGY